MKKLDALFDSIKDKKPFPYNQKHMDMKTQIRIAKYLVKRLKSKKKDEAHLTSSLEHMFNHCLNEKLQCINSLEEIVGALGLGLDKETEDKAKERLRNLQEDIPVIELSFYNSIRELNENDRRVHLTKILKKIPGSLQNTARNTTKNDSPKLPEEVHELLELDDEEPTEIGSPTKEEQKKGKDSAETKSPRKKRKGKIQAHGEKAHLHSAMMILRTQHSAIIPYLKGKREEAKTIKGDKKTS